MIKASHKFFYVVSLYGQDLEVEAYVNHEVGVLEILTLKGFCKPDLVSTSYKEFLYGNTCSNLQTNVESLAAKRVFVISKVVYFFFFSHIRYFTLTCDTIGKIWTYVELELHVIADVVAVGCKNRHLKIERVGFFLILVFPSLLCGIETCLEIEALQQWNVNVYAKVESYMSVKLIRFGAAQFCKVDTASYTKSYRLLGFLC